MTKISAEELVGEEWAEWYRLTPMERFRESEKLWETYLSLGGSLDPEPDTQSPFFDRSAHEPSEANREIWRTSKAEREHLRRIRNKA